MTTTSRLVVRELRYLLCAAAIGAPLWFYFAVIRPHQQHMEWYRGVERRIVRLAEHQPAGLTEAQWAACIYWTWQLHGNWGPAFQEPAASRFLAEFDNRLAGEVGLGTIDWVWDEYGRHAPGGRPYSENYRPTTPESLKRVAEVPDDAYALEPWRERLRRMGR